MMEFGACMIKQSGAGEILALATIDPLVHTRTDPLPRPAAGRDTECPLSSAKPNGDGIGGYQPVLKIR